MPKSIYTIETLLRGLNILTLFTHEKPALSLTEITAATSLNKTTVFRFVSTLEESGFLFRDPETKKYRPGVKVLQLGFSALASLELRQVARPYLEQLSQRVGLTVSLSILDQMEIIYIDRVRNQQIVGVLLGLGSRLPAHCTSMGKAMLAHLPTEELLQRVEATGLMPRTSKSLVDLVSLKKELTLVREQGFAINDEELEIGLRAVAAPIWNGTNRVVAATNITGSVAMISRERLVGELAHEVRRTAMHISQALGYSDAGLE